MTATISIYVLCFRISLAGLMLYFARKIANRAEYGFNTLKNSKDVHVFDSSLQNDRRGLLYNLNVFALRFSYHMCIN